MSRLKLVPSTLYLRFQVAILPNQKRAVGLTCSQVLVSWITLMLPAVVVKIMNFENLEVQIKYFFLNKTYCTTVE